jgi:DNA replication protein DnaC
MFAERKARSEMKLRSFEDVAAGVEAQGKNVQDFIKWINKQVQCPDRFTHAFPADLPKAIKEWWATTDGSRGMYVYGPVGTGKTHALYALAKLIRANGYEVKVKNVPDWLDSLRSNYERSNSEQEIKDELRDECVLILDDLGSEKQTEWTNEIMYRLVNNRYEQIRPTIFSGNLDLEEVAQKYGDRIASRIFEMVGGDRGIINIGGEDRRLKS